MILRPLQPAQIFYRFNTPRWAYRPTSGAGAAKVGGRFNRPGVDALYLSRDCEWRRQALYEGIEPPSWILADIAVERGAKGILFPSTRHAGGCNLVVYTQQLDHSDKLSAHDPRGDLPNNQDSWLR